MKHGRIAIVGGGLAGLGAAHALKAFGFQAEVYEAAPELGEIGELTVGFSTSAPFTAAKISTPRKDCFATNRKPARLRRAQTRTQPLARAASLRRHCGQSTISKPSPVPAVF